MKEEFRQYRVSDPGFLWENTWRYGDGYDVMEAVRDVNWAAISSWGKDGYDLGSWPYVVIFFQNKDDHYNLVYYCEGDVTMWSCPTREIREAITNELAFFHWEGEDWVKGYATVDDLPADLRGPCRFFVGAKE